MNKTKDSAEVEVDNSRAVNSLTTGELIEIIIHAISRSEAEPIGSPGLADFKPLETDSTDVLDLKREGRELEELLREIRRLIEKANSPDIFDRVEVLEESKRMQELAGV